MARACWQAKSFITHFYNLRIAQLFCFLHCSYPLNMIPTILKLHQWKMCQDHMKPILHNVACVANLNGSATLAFALMIIQ